MGEKESEADAKTQLAVLAVILLFFVKYFSGIFKGYHIRRIFVIEFKAEETVAFSRQLEDCYEVCKDGKIS